jgi:hypothetical protein
MCTAGPWCGGIIRADRVGYIKPRGEAGSKKAEQAERRPYMVTTRDAGQAVVAIPRLPVAIVDPKRRTLSISFRH